MVAMSFLRDYVAFAILAVLIQDVAILSIHF
jgi:hypothetical protein